MTKQFLILLLALAPSLLYGQKTEKLKKKFFGTYEGMIPAYKEDIGGDVVNVSEISIVVELSADSLHIAIGNHHLKGSYEVMFKADDYYLLDARMEGQLAAERILVYKRGKRIAREGMYPQPLAELEKK